MHSQETSSLHGSTTMCRALEAISTAQRKQHATSLSATGC